MTLTSNDYAGEIPPTISLSSLSDPCHRQRGRNDARFPVLVPQAKRLVPSRHTGFSRFRADMLFPAVWRMPRWRPSTTKLSMECAVVLLINSHWGFVDLEAILILPLKSCPAWCKQVGPLSPSIRACIGYWDHCSSWSDSYLSQCSLLLIISDRFPKGISYYNV